MTLIDNQEGICYMSDKKRKILTRVLAIVLAASMIASSAYYLIATLLVG